MSSAGFGREPVTYVQIDQDFCRLTYGVGACGATGGAGQECFNTRATCQAKDDYDRGTRTLTFCTRQEEIGVDGLYVIPSLVSVSSNPTELNPGGSSKDSGSLGRRSSVSITFDDHPHSDNRVDPYRENRGYIATDRSTFWAKWLARNPYYNNREVRIYEGYRGQSLSEMQSRTYIIDSITGPDSGGTVRIKAKDILRLADNDSAQAPAPSQGELKSDISATDSSFTIKGVDDPSDYPDGAPLRVEDEIIRFAGKSHNAGDSELTLNGVQRGLSGTDAEGHDADERVQACLEFSAVSVEKIVRDLLVEYGNVPARFIDFADWQQEATTWLNEFTLSAIIPEPMGVTDLIGELSEQCLFNIWWDERAQQIQFEAVKPPGGEPPVLDDQENILAGSSNVKEKPEERVSQIWLFYGVRDPTKDKDEESNYRSLRIRADTEAENPAEYGEQRIRKIYSRWLRTDAQVLTVSTRLLSRFRNNPRYLTVEADAKDRALWVGAVVDVSTRTIVDATGMPQTTRWQVISAEEIEPGHAIRYSLQLYEYKVGERFGGWMEANAPVYNDASKAELESGSWWATVAGVMPDGTEPYRWT